MLCNITSQQCVSQGHSDASHSASQCGGKETPGRSGEAQRTVCQTHSPILCKSLLEISASHTSLDICASRAKRAPTQKMKREGREHATPTIRAMPETTPPLPPPLFRFRFRRCSVSFERRLSALALMTSTAIPSSSPPFPLPVALRLALRRLFPP